jgi:hypothetical protein
MFPDRRPCMVEIMLSAHPEAVPGVMQFRSRLVGFDPGGGYSISPAFDDLRRRHSSDSGNGCPQSASIVIPE